MERYVLPVSSRSDMYFREGRCTEQMELIRVRESKACRRRAFRFAISSLLRNGRVQDLHSRATRKHRGRAIRVILFARAALIGPLFAPASRVSFHYIDPRDRYSASDAVARRSASPRGAGSINARLCYEVAKKNRGDLIRYRMCRRTRNTG